METKDPVTGPPQWYLFRREVSEAHEGPFSGRQIQWKLSLGEIDEDCYVWQTGMGDWARLKDVEILDDAPEAILDPPPPSLEEIIAFSPPAQGFAEAPVLPPVAFEATPTIPGPKLGWRWLGAGLLAAMAVGVGLWWFVSPSRLSALIDVSPEDLKGMSTARESSIFGSTPRAYIAVATRDPFHPFFYIGTNLRDGSKLDVLIEGSTETLIGGFAVSERAAVTVVDGLGKTPIFQKGAGRRQPTGDYRVTVSCLNCAEKSASEPLAVRTVFVGGEKDDAYFRSLEKYHAELQVQAQSEISEIKQLTDTIESQLHETGETYSHHRKLWLMFHEKWEDFEAQLNTFAESLTDTKLTRDKYYGDLYRLLKQEIELVRHIHTEQNTALQHSSDANVENRIVADTVIAQNVLLSLRTKTVLIERLPATKSGMPPRAP